MKSAISGADFTADPMFAVALPPPQCLFIFDGLYITGSTKLCQSASHSPRERHRYNLPSISKKNHGKIKWKPLSSQGASVYTDVFGIGGVPIAFSLGQGRIFNGKKNR